MVGCLWGGRYGGVSSPLASVMIATPARNDEVADLVCATVTSPLLVVDGHRVLAFAVPRRRDDPTPVAPRAVAVK